MSPYAPLAAAALAVAAALGAFGAHWYYAPRLDAAQVRAQALAGAAEACSRGTEALRAAGAERDAQAKAATERARSAARSAEARAQRLLATERPAGVGECAAVAALMRAELAR